MDINIAALVREGTKTVGVRFWKDYNNSNKPTTLLGLNSIPELPEKEYTYVTDLSLQVGQLVVVFVSEVPKIVLVTRVDTDLEITPNDTTRYNWIAGVFDITPYQQLLADNAKIEHTLASAYKKQTRKSFSQLLLNELGLEEASELRQLISKKGEKE